LLKEEEGWVTTAFENCVNEEKSWAKYLFKDGSMIGLNDKLLNNYVEWVANRQNERQLVLNQSTIFLQKTIPFLGQNIGFLLKVFR
jgi:ribonucleotide reductase beta subunit family protein with ferritin-like domain